MNGARIVAGGVTVIVAAVIASILATGGGNLEANVWTIASASPNGTCTRFDTPEKLSDAVDGGRVCNPGDDSAGALKAAATAAGDGDVIGIANDAIYGVQTLNNMTKTLTFEGDTSARPRLRQMVMGDTSANLTFRHLDFVRAADASNNSATWSNGTGAGTGSDDLTVEDVTVDSSYLSNRAGLFDEGSRNTYTDVDVCCVVNEKGALLGGDHLTFNRLALHDVYLTSELVHNECMFNSGSDWLLLENSHFYNCQTIDLQNTRFCGNGGAPADDPVHDVTIRNNVFEHTLGGLGIGTMTPWHVFSVGWVGNGLSCADYIPSGDPLIRWTVVNNTFETTTPLPTDIECIADGGDPCVWANNVGNWSCGTGWVFSHNVGTSCDASDVAVSPSTSSSTVPAAFGWTDPLAHDFTLATGSPAIGVCDEEYAPATDKNGVTRGDPCDAGPYEHGG